MAANSNLSIIRNFIQTEFGDTTLKNILFTERPDGTFLWITLSPDSAHVSDKIIPQIKKVLRAL